ncbi:MULTISPECIES: MgtC/SapB family protein [Bacillota]|jgi:putative Mg2+ transporter-C (MgtC) family protein|uniref:MgtC/SapB family protein n=2 Tax=Amedibacillus TaxID=2749846 RepID=A0A7G9GLD8_9FIRM|nr:MULTISPECIES: MgtC/SapB family protein [Bacillota]QNM11620.1 MgtC/SapB family protein [[Eubacterium] hominis]MCH4285134.1 MgtC/SapB family protein [Amedibacillus hominis]RGB56162.1 MgtC/SapB family protein [Absiella sp. AM22-9]RGB61923.1 MgtC/SapB family protein [Absiella sp. AM10-20]RGB70255.1 MgtC/SapB family protein [Absiella sp. AM09-45]
MNQFLWTQVELLCRIIIAGICGGIIGYERKNRNKEAGIRTHMIVALGASLIMIVSKYGFADILGEQGIALDPSRIAAQIVTGVGFLGAGMIFMRKNTISGLTTAAGIWATSAIGMSIGSGLYLLGIVTTVLIVVIQIILHGRLLKETYKDEISFLLKKDKNAVQDLQKQLESMHIEILNIEIKKHNEFYMVEMVVSLPENYHATEMLKLFQHCDYIEEVNI